MRANALLCTWLAQALSALLGCLGSDEGQQMAVMSVQGVVTVFAGLG